MHTLSLHSYMWVNLSFQAFTYEDDTDVTVVWEYHSFVFLPSGGVRPGLTR